MTRTRLVAAIVLIALGSSAVFGQETKSKQQSGEIRELLDRVGAPAGVCVFVGLPESGKERTVIDLASASELLIYVQSSVDDEIVAMRQTATAAGLLGKRIWVDKGTPQSIQIADNLADAVFVSPSAVEAGAAEDEVLRVLHPQAKGWLGDKVVAKPLPAGLQSWSHPYHGPSNNTQSVDEVARYPYLTQFLGEPMFGCISEVTVASGGRVFKAFGHIAFKEISNDVLNTLFAINGYNGQIIWKRKLKEGFMIHRSTMIATPETLFLADDESCKLIDARTGEVKREISPPADVAGGKVWKWMVKDGDVLYAMIGGEEVSTALRRGNAEGYGGWPWGMWQGYDYKNPEKSFGFGRTLLAIDIPSGKIIWRHEEEDYLDGRALCMHIPQDAQPDDRGARGGHLYAYSPGNFLLALDAQTGKPEWKNNSTEMLDSIGENGRAQGYIRGFSTTSYMKCSDKHIFFAGPQRSRLAAVSAKDGKPLWNYGDGNFQLVLRDDVLYAFGPQRGKSAKLDPSSGEVLALFEGRRACTRATGSIDSMFCRASGGTIRMSPGSDAVEHIAPMRPACHDGVIVSDGMLYWGPWICACKLSLFGHIGLGPAGAFDFQSKPDESERLALGAGDPYIVAEAKEGTGPTTFTGGDDGVVRALRGDKVVWTAHTGGSINFPPVAAEGRVYAGSNDGRVYAYEAATGRLLWSFRAAPQVRRIPVYGQLMSTWPVAGGVAVKDGMLYAAAGIAHFDGTHVYALDAKSGKIKWHSGDSGTLSPTLKNGISLSGQLRLGKSPRGQDVLQFPGGNAVGLAQYDLETGKCLSPVPTTPTGVSRSVFYVEQWVKRRAGLKK